MITKSAKYFIWLYVVISTFGIITLITYYNDYIFGFTNKGGYESDEEQRIRLNCSSDNNNCLWECNEYTSDIDNYNRANIISIGLMCLGFNMLLLVLTYSENKDYTLNTIIVVINIICGYLIILIISHFACYFIEFARCAYYSNFVPWTTKILLFAVLFIIYMIIYILTIWLGFGMIECFTAHELKFLSRETIYVVSNPPQYEQAIQNKITSYNTEDIENGLKSHSLKPLPLPTYNNIISNSLKIEDV